VGARVGWGRGDAEGDPSEALKAPSQDAPTDYGIWGSVMSSPVGYGAERGQKIKINVLSKDVY